MQKNLILVANPNGMDPGDFEEIAENVRRDNKRLDTFVVRVDQPASVIADRFWRNPTLIVAFGETGAFQAPRGILLQNRSVHKYQQYVQFCLAGVNTPRTANFDRNNEYLESDWGEFCILKPSDLGRMGKGGSVRLQRTRRLKAFDIAHFPEDHVYRKSKLLMQSFIDTGPLAVNWRVLTLLGEPLYCFRSSSGIERPPLDAPDEIIEKAIVEPKHPDGKEKVGYENLRRFEADAEVMAFARHVNPASHFRAATSCGRPPPASSTSWKSIPAAIPGIFPRRSSPASVACWAARQSSPASSAPLRALPTSSPGARSS
jgi:hypothetical protein